jgi:hypothetical protein
MCKASMATNLTGNHGEGVPLVPLEEGHHGHRLVPDGWCKLKLDRALDEN